MRNLFLAAVAAAGLAACSLVAGDPLDEARAAYDRQDYPAARTGAQAALAQDADGPGALELLARVQVATGQGQAALATLARLDDARALPADANLLRAEALLQTGEVEAARAALTGQRSAEAWRLRALAAARQGDDAAVKAAFRNGHGAEGDKLRLYTLEATWHLDRGDAEGARRAVGEVQRLAPEAVETLFVSARFANLLGEHELAARAYMAILERNPSDRPALLGAIASARNLGRMDIAAPLVARGSAAWPGDIAFVYHTALLDADAGRWPAVRERLQRSERAVIDFAPARLLYGQAMLELGQVEQARSMVQPLAEAYPDNAEYRATLARIDGAARG
ncbi:tetratricopeptide repeat protein [Aurantiacibacter luteus]|uniref:Uncharacterized protein n=1 Tax=Aurantiacibacter luteus TaxID=1581420 RepID=A0A0G9MXN2_9SPHN|nr:tetratricopeptide repeat protein [Aurantiacibacter luteus]KLE35496.1 hypothetical protein AAW00_03460 [Aurantiacibacter luteus]